MLMEHRELRAHREAMMSDIESGKGIKEALESHGKIIIEKLRERIKDEDEVLYAIALEELSGEEIGEINSTAE